MMYESQNLNFENHKVSFVITDTATLYYLYYLEMPPPSSTPTLSYTPEPTPYDGAVYLENNYLYEVNYDLNNLAFDKCSAKIKMNRFCKNIEFSTCNFLSSAFPLTRK